MGCAMPPAPPLPICCLTFLMLIAAATALLVVRRQLNDAQRFREDRLALQIAWLSHIDGFRRARIQSRRAATPAYFLPVPAAEVIAATGTRLT